MESFNMLMTAIRSDENFDIFRRLPLELSVFIFNMLDNAALSEACMVSRRWWAICYPLMRKRKARFLRGRIERPAAPKGSKVIIVAGLLRSKRTNALKSASRVARSGPSKIGYLPRY